MLTWHYLCTKTVHLECSALFIHTVVFTCTTLRNYLRTMLRNIHLHTKKFPWVQWFFPAEYNFCKLSLMYICATRYLCNVIWQFVLELPCSFSSFPHFQITFPSVVIDFNSDFLAKIFLIRWFLKRKLQHWKT